MSPHDRYESPLVARNASPRMSALFGARNRVRTWRRIWLALAEAQHRAGLPISTAQLDQLRGTLDDIDFDSATAHEKRLRHDVMAHVYAWGERAPDARAILHLGATSADVVDNADLVLMRDAMRLIAVWLANVIDALGAFAAEHRAAPTLGFTHFQPAQITTVGKRAAMWCADFVRDLDDVERRLAGLRFRGIKGATGTQASFLSLLGDDHEKVLTLEREVARAFDFDAVEPITGQTYSRKIDGAVLGVLAQIAVSVHKFANDVRLLAHRGEIEEPFEEEQVGSSAMPYKRNPMRCERATGLARLVISLAQSALQTGAEQWLERTLDDSSNRRVTIPEAFLATDGMLRIVSNVARGLMVYPRTIERRLREELPMVATEEILVAATAAGGDRQSLHECIRRHAMEASLRVRRDGEPNDLIARLRADPAFAKTDFDRLLDPSRYVGRAPRQVDAFLAEFVEPVRKRYAGSLGQESELSV
jgi:adenylosuccinate lyase